MTKKIIITGGAGFIGSTLIKHLMKDLDYFIINIDKLTYAGNLQALYEVKDNPRYFFIKADIVDYKKMVDIFCEFEPDGVIHLAAESHVDKSIANPGQFIQTNIIGTYNLLEAARTYLTNKPNSNFRFVHVSTDEVYGDLEPLDNAFTENNPYKPSSPYSASKASSDHLVKAWHRTYQFPSIITNCSNNYGPYQFPEKLIPFMISRALGGETLTLYGDGAQIRDWLYVEDHVKALSLVLNQGKVGETYNIGGLTEKSNLDITKTICDILDDLVLYKPFGLNKFSDLITFVKDRPGHDRRYAIDCRKLINELGWTPQESFESGIRKTVEWNISHSRVCKEMLQSC